MCGVCVLKMNSVEGEVVDDLSILPIRFLIQNFINGSCLAVCHLALSRLSFRFGPGLDQIWNAR